MVTDYRGEYGLAKIPEYVKGKPVVRINERAFEDKYVTAIIVPKTVKLIGDRAFDAIGLEYVFISKGVEDIICAFNGCDYDVKIYCEDEIIPSGWTDRYWNAYRIGYSYYTEYLKTYTGCIINEDFVAQKNSDGGLSVIRYIGNDPKVNIPGTIKGLKVTEIGAKLFYQDEFVEEVTIAEGIQKVGPNAFNGAKKLTKIYISNTVKTISIWSFHGIPNLEKVIIPQTVTTIEGYSFGNCPLATIYCKSASKPEGWDEAWCTEGQNIIWGYNG